MRRSLIPMASVWLMAAQACGGEHDHPVADWATSDKGAGGKGAEAGVGGEGGSGGAQAASGGATTGSGSAKAGADGARAASGGATTGSAGSGSATAGAGGAQAASGGAATGSAGSGDARPRTVTIRFKAKLGDEDLECGKIYRDQGKTKAAASPQDFRFFVEQVHLIARDGDEVPLQFDERAPFQTRDVALIDFTQRRGSRCTVGGTTVNTTISGTVPAGEYAGIVFVNGVPESLNHQNLTSAKPPLQDTTTYWGWSSGYRFILASLAVDPGDTTATRRGSNLVHIGSGGCSGSSRAGFRCTRPNRNRIRLDHFDPDQSTIIADLSKVFADIDLHDAVECHGPDPACQSAYTALGVSLSSGAALDVQKVFRVE